MSMVVGIQMITQFSQIYKTIFYAGFEDQVVLKSVLCAHGDLTPGESLNVRWVQRLNPVARLASGSMLSEGSN